MSGVGWNHPVCRTPFSLIRIYLFSSLFIHLYRPFSLPLIFNACPAHTMYVAPAWPFVNYKEFHSQTSWESPILYDRNHNRT